MRTISQDNHLITYHSGGNSSQIDYILVRKSDFKQVRNIKVIPGEEVVTQHWLLVRDMKWKFVKQTKKTFIPKLRTWKLKDHVINLFKDRLTHLLASDTNEKSVKTSGCILKPTYLRQLKRLVVFPSKENGTSRLGGGITQ